jgi:NAD(P)-dependent dehydrogenase (short-subunit alcohol dehydrogenase family)
MQDVRNKVAFITGGASGIGLGIATVFVEAGMQVAIADLRADHLDQARARFAAMHASDQVLALRLDVMDRAAMARAADETQRRFGKVHVLVNNAGVGLEGPLEQATYDDWDFGLGVNLGGVINGLQAFLPRIRAHGEGGHIVNTASLAGLLVMPAHMCIYVTGKAAVIALSESIRTGLAEAGIGVSVLCPGPIKSNIHECADNRPERFRTSSGFHDSEARLAQRQVSNLWMEPETVGRMVLDAIRRNELYVITHGEWRQALIDRFQAILAAMPEKVNPDLIASLRQPQFRDAETEVQGRVSGV